MQARQLEDVSLDCGSVGRHWSNVEGSPGQMSTNFDKLCFRHCRHCLLKSGSDRIDSFRLRMFVDPLLQFGSSKVGLADPFAIDDNVAGHGMRLLKNAAPSTGKLDLRMFALEDSSRVLGYWFELQFFNSHDFLL